MREFNDQPPNAKTALDYASRRGWAVLPMRGKKFYTRDGVRMATRDPNIIKQWDWAENVGMACGEPSRTDVFDIDDAEASQRPVSISTRWPLQRWPQQRHQAGGTCSSSLQDFAAAPILCGEWRSTGLAVALPPAPGRRWLNDLSPQPAPPVLIELVKQLIKSAVVFSSFPLLVATGDELPKPIYEALLRAMPLGPVLSRRHQRWAGSILRKLIAYRDGRNAALMRATFEFRSIIAQGLIAEADARSLLVMACSANGYLGKVGSGQVNATISWALKPLEERRRE